MYIHKYIYTYGKPYIYREKCFPLGGIGGEPPTPPTSLKFAHPPNLEEFPLSRLPPSHQIFIPPTTKQ